ncbi:MAG: ABC transporter permease [Clostridiaceae bacterium]
MLKRFLFSCKKKGATLVIAIFGYFLCITIMSIMINQVILYNKIWNNAKMGKVSNYVFAVVTSNLKEEFDGDPMDMINEYAKKGKVDIIGLGESDILSKDNNAKVQVIPTLFYKKTDWTPALIKGRYLTPEESIKGTPVVVIGKNIANDLKVDIGDTVEFYDMKYKVIGVMGFKYANQLSDSGKWDDVFVISLNGLPENYLNIFKEKTIKTQQNGKKYLGYRMIFRIKANQFEEVTNQINNDSNNKSVEISNTQSNQYGETSVFMDVKKTIYIAIPIIFVALFNVINISLFWIMDRKKEITIKKCIGATNKLMIKTMRIELMSIGIVATILSFLVQKLLENKLELFLNKFELSLQFSWVSFVISILMALGIGYLTTILPARKILSMEPAEALRYE